MPRWPKHHRATELLVVEVGSPAWAAAVAAAERGLGVILAEADATLGGRAFDAGSRAELTLLLDRARLLDHLEVLCGHLAIGLYDDRVSCCAAQAASSRCTRIAWSWRPAAWMFPISFRTTTCPA